MPKKDFTKTKQHHVFLGGAHCYDVWQLSLCELVVRLLCIGMLQ